MEGNALSGSLSVGRVEAGHESFQSFGGASLGPSQRSVPGGLPICRRYRPKDVIIRTKFGTVRGRKQNAVPGDLNRVGQKECEKTAPSRGLLIVALFWRHEKSIAGE